MNGQIEDLKSKKNMAQGELLGLEEKLILKDEEIDKLKTLQSTSVTDFESRQNQFRQTQAKMQVELQRKESEIKDLLENNTGGKELQKDNALLEQKIGLKQRTVEDLKV